MSINLSRTRWTNREIRLLKLLVAGIKNISIPGRSLIAIQHKIRELKLKKDRRYDTWSVEEIEKVWTGQHVEGRSARSVARKRASLGLYKRSPRFEWDECDEQTLRQACAKGYSARKIFKEQLLPNKYSITAIQKKMCRLGLSKKNKKFKRIDHNTKAILIKFITDNWMGKLPEELAAMWNEKHYEYLVTGKKIAHYLAKLNIKVSCHEMGYIRRLKEFEQQIKLNINQENLILINEKIRLKRVQTMRRRFENNKDIWTGLDMEVPINMNEDD